MNPNLSPDEKTHRELYQQAHAIFAVYNPTPHDYRLIFDRHLYIIPNSNKDIGKGKGTEYLSAYLAKKYATEMTNKLLQEKASKLVEDENTRRREAGMALLTKYQGENSQEVVEGQIRINDASTRAPVMKQLILGLVQKAPEDLTLAVEKENQNTGTPIDDQIFNSLSATEFRPEYSSPAPSVTPQALNNKKEELINQLQTPNVT